ncbi:MAG: Gfo/Idh/MocA family oxidoreductase [Verrucomicrobiia bacterium]
MKEYRLSRRTFVGQLPLAVGAFSLAARPSLAAERGVLNVGFIGLKGHQGTVVSALKEAGCRAAMVCDDDRAMLNRAKKWPTADADTKFHTDWRAALDDGKLDIVCEAGVDSSRATILKACAERGIHVISEKPLAFTLDELAGLKNAVAKARTHLSMLLTMRFEPAYRVIREQIAAGAIGKVCQAAMQKSYKLGNRPEWLRNHSTFGGIIPYIGIHALDLIRWTTGCEFTSAMGFQGNTGHPDLRDMEDNASIALQLANGGSAAVRLDYCRPATAPTHGDDRLRIAGSKGVIESSEAGKKVTLITETEPPRELPLSPPGKQFLNYVRSIQGQEPCVVPAGDCFRITEVVLKIRDAAKRGEPVKL